MLKQPQKELQQVKRWKPRYDLEQDEQLKDPTKTKKQDMKEARDKQKEANKYLEKGKA